MRRYRKKEFPVDQVRRFLEPGPVVLVSSQHKGVRNIMTLGWHMMLEYDQIGAFVWDQNDSFQSIRKSRECVINVPTADMINTVIAIGNQHGPRRKGVDKFDQFRLTAEPGDEVAAPRIAECFANFECRLSDVSLIKKYSLFAFDVVKAHVATSPKYPKTVHYRGDGVFMTSGPSRSYRRRFKKVNL